MRPRMLALATVFACLLAPSLGRATEDADLNDPIELSLGVPYLAAFEEGSVHHLVGVGGSFSAYFVPHLLSFELVSHALFGEHVQSFPVDLVVKADAVLSRVVHPYVTLGPTVVPEVAHGEAKVWIGAALALGVDLWFSHHWGFMVELNGNLIARRGVRPEVGAFVGPVLRF